MLLWLLWPIYVASKELNSKVKNCNNGNHIRLGLQQNIAHVSVNWGCVQLHTYDQIIHKLANYFHCQRCIVTAVRRWLKYEKKCEQAEVLSSWGSLYCVNIFYVKLGSNRWNSTFLPKKNALKRKNQSFSCFFFISLSLAFDLHIFSDF